MSQRPHIGSRNIGSPLQRQIILAAMRISLGILAVAITRFNGRTLRRRWRLALAERQPFIYVAVRHR